MQRYRVSRIGSRKPALLFPSIRAGDKLALSLSSQMHAKLSPPHVQDYSSSAWIPTWLSIYYGATPSQVLRALSARLKLASTMATLYSRSSNSTPRLHQERSQKAENPTFSTCHQTSLVGALCMAYYSAWCASVYLSMTTVVQPDHLAPALHIDIAMISMHIHGSAWYSAWRTEQSVLLSLCSGNHG